MYRFDDFLVDPEAWRISRDGQEIHLEPLVLELLIYLIANRERLVTRQELMDTVWGDTVISESALTKAVARLRQALGDDSATHRYLETVRSRGYRFIAAVEEMERPDTPSGRTPASNNRRGTIVGVAAMIALVVLAVFWAREPEHGTSQAEAIGSLAVLPLHNLTGDTEQDYYVDGLQDLLISELAQLSGLRVTSRQSTIRYRGSQLPATDIAKELGVDALVEGSLLREGSKIEVSIQLIDGRSDEHLWAERYARDTPYVFDLVSDMARAIGTEIVSATAPPTSQVPDHGLAGPVDPRAIDAYALGLMHMDRLTPDGIRFAIERFQEAVDVEPEFALAWGHLAAAYVMQGLRGIAPPRESIEQARAAALRAIEVDPESYIGHSSIGWIRLWTGDLTRACDSLEEALRLNPSDPFVIHGDADCLMLAGHMDESIARMRELVTISPYSTISNGALAYHLFLARRYEESIAAVNVARERVPGFLMHYTLARVYWVQGEFDKALEAERLEFEQRGDTALLAALDEGRDASGPMGAMRAIAEAMVARSNESYVDPFEIGKTFARAGMVDEALHWLNRAFEYGSYEMTYLAFRPDFDILREDPRYRDLADRVYGPGNPIAARP
ncbi:MAG: winged helix-turn-helix domain-containing protein [Woeseiaceae bacterium]|nr:winged helix-turn-helix domain-containing protein [Woeseiaceae bacterium]